jgi:hypothetical protein
VEPLWNVFHCRFKLKGEVAMEAFVHLVGVTFRGGEAKEIVKHLTREDGVNLSLECEPDNAYDSCAVKVIHDPTGTHIGYLARENNYDVFSALQNATELCIEIVGFENTLKPTLLITDVPEHALDDTDAEEDHFTDIPSGMNSQ